MGILDLFKQKERLPASASNPPFPIDRERYPAAFMLDAWKKADKTKPLILLEPVGCDISVEITGFQDTSSAYVEDFLSHITDIDYKVQEFCKLNYDSSQLEMKNYIVTLAWITVNGGASTVEMGYWGKHVNVELRAVLEKRKDHWEMADIHYQ